MAETWYVLIDGTAADPRLVALGEDGVLRHQDGREVAMRGQVPSTRSVYDTTEARAEPSPDPKPRRGYKTRKAEAG